MDPVPVLVAGGGKLQACRAARTGVSPSASAELARLWLCRKYLPAQPALWFDHQVALQACCLILQQNHLSYISTTFAD